MDSETYDDGEEDVLTSDKNKNSGVDSSHAIADDMVPETWGWMVYCVIISFAVGLTALVVAGVYAKKFDDATDQGTILTPTQLASLTTLPADLIAAANTGRDAAVTKIDAALAAAVVNSTTTTVPIPNIISLFTILFDQQIASRDALIASQQTQITALTTIVNTLRGQVTDNTFKTGNLTNQVTLLSTRIDSLNSSLTVSNTTAISQQIAAIQTIQTSLVTTVSTILTNQTYVNSRITGLQNLLDDTRSGVEVELHELRDRDASILTTECADVNALFDYVNSHMAHVDQFVEGSIKFVDCSSTFPPTCPPGFYYSSIVNVSTHLPSQIASTTQLTFICLCVFDPAFTNVSLAVESIGVFQTPRPCRSTAPVVCESGLDIAFGSAQPFALFGANGIDSTGPSYVTGGMGVRALNVNVTGFRPADGDLGTGPFSYLHEGDASARVAQDDIISGISDVTGQSVPCTTFPLWGNETELVDISNTITPAYCYFFGNIILSVSSLKLTSNATFPQYLFRVNGSLTIPDDFVLNTFGGNLNNKVVRPHGITWYVTGNVVIGNQVMFTGTLIAGGSITVGRGSVINGRLWAPYSTVTIDSSIVTVPVCSSVSLGTVMNGIQFPTGSAVDYSILASTSVASTGNTRITSGCVGSSGTLTGLDSVSGIAFDGCLRTADDSVSSALAFASLSYSEAIHATCGSTISGTLAGQTIVSGISCVAGNANLINGGVLTISGGLDSDEDTEFTIVVNGALNVTQSNVKLIGNARERNVNWYVSGAVFISGSESAFVGSVTTPSTISAIYSPSVTGRLVSLQSSVSVETLTISLPDSLN